MIVRCVSEPVSWLLLERRALDELEVAERARVDAHLAACAACAACAAHLAADRVTLRPLDLAPPARAPRGRVVRWAAPAALALAAAIAAAVLVPRDPAAPLGDGVKGGELAVEVVGPDGVARRSAAVGEALRVRVSCGARATRGWDVVVFDADGASFPLAGGSLSCANGVVLPGAFRLDRAGDAEVCVALDPAPRAALSMRAALSGDHACAPLAVR